MKEGNSFRLLRSVGAATVLLGLMFVTANIGGCGKLNRENYDKIQNGMTVQQVQEILGKPDETTSGGTEVLGFGGTATTMTWRSGDQSIVVTFVNDKVVRKSMNNL